MDSRPEHAVGKLNKRLAHWRTVDVVHTTLWPSFFFSSISISNKGRDKDGGVAGALLVDNDVTPLRLYGLDTLFNASSTPKIEYSDLVSCLSN